MQMGKSCRGEVGEIRRMKPRPRQDWFNNQESGGIIVFGGFPDVFFGGVGLLKHRAGSFGSPQLQPLAIKQLAFVTLPVLGLPPQPRYFVKHVPRLAVFGFGCRAGPGFFFCSSSRGLFCNSGAGKVWAMPVAL